MQSFHGVIFHDLLQVYLLYWMLKLSAVLRTLRTYEKKNATYMAFIAIMSIFLLNLRNNDNSYQTEWISQLIFCRKLIVQDSLEQKRPLFYLEIRTIFNCINSTFKNNS